MIEPQLKPCPFCGGAGTAYAGRLGEFPWVVRFEHDAPCPLHGHNPYDANAYKMQAEAIAVWNTRTPATELERELYEALKNIAFAGGNSCQFATDLDCLRQMESLARVALARAGGGVK